MYSNASNFVKGVDDAFVFILGVAAFFLISLTIVMIYLIIRYNKKRNPVATQISGSTSLEILWTVIPFFLVMIMFYLGWKGWKPSREKAPNDAIVIKTTARMWSWTFQYPSGKTTDTLYVPVGKPVKLDLISLDVIHGLFIPSFRLKQDVIPGRTGMMWFIAEKPGSYDIFCTQYCGLRHSYMAASIVAMNEASYKKWYTDTTRAIASAGGKPISPGFEIIKKNGCLACHSIDGSPLVGPSYKSLYGSKVQVTTDDKEREIIANDEYIKRSIYEPNADVVKGFNKNMMLSYKTMINEEELKQVIEYIKTLK